MFRRSLCIVLIGIGHIHMQASAATEPAPESPAAKPSATELVQGIIDAENKIQEIRSLYLRFEGKWTHTPAAIAEARAELQKQSRESELDEKRYSNLWPEITEELELAYDEGRVRYYSDSHDSHRDLRVFDGTQAIAHGEYFTHKQENYTLRSQPDEFFGSYFINLSWLRVGTPTFWFVKDNFTPEIRQNINGYPKDYQHVGTEVFRGRACYVLENALAHRRLHVGMDDQRLHQLTFFRMPEGTDTQAAAKAAAGRTFSNRAEEQAWFIKLSEPDRRAYAERLNRGYFPLMRPWAEHFLDEYRELTAGLWIPATQGHVIVDEKDHKTPTISRELHLIEARVNEPLDDKLFRVELKEGVQVADSTYDPPLFYNYKANRTPEEFQAIIETAKQQNDGWQKENAARDALVGRPAPDLPQRAWLNGPQLDWPALKGKVVLLDFWATTCGPCRNDLPQVEELHQQSADEGIVAIGIHTAGGDPDEVASFAKEMKLTYPIAIDQPGEGRYTFGQFFNQVAIRAIPYSIVVDRDGKIAAHGSLREVLPKARELAQPAK